MARIGYGKKFKSLKRHLSAHYALTADEYREKRELKQDYPMVTLTTQLKDQPLQSRRGSVGSLQVSQRKTPPTSARPADVDPCTLREQRRNAPRPVDGVYHFNTILNLWTPAMHRRLLARSRLRRERPQIGGSQCQSKKTTIARTGLTMLSLRKASRPLLQGAMRFWKEKSKRSG
jgi:hypothetical protein